MENPTARKAIDTLLKFAGNQKGATFRLTRYLSESVDGIIVSEDIVQNTLTKHRYSFDDADSFVKLLNMKESEGVVEYLQVHVDDKFGILVASLNLLN